MQLDQRSLRKPLLVLQEIGPYAVVFFFGSAAFTAGAYSSIPQGVRAIAGQDLLSGLFLGAAIDLTAAAIGARAVVIFGLPFFLMLSRILMQALLLVARILFKKRIYRFVARARRAVDRVFLLGTNNPGIATLLLFVIFSARALSETWKDAGIAIVTLVLSFSLVAQVDRFQAKGLRVRFRYRSDLKISRSLVQYSLVSGLLFVMYFLGHESLRDVVSNGSVVRSKAWPGELVLVGMLDEGALLVERGLEDSQNPEDKLWMFFPAPMPTMEIGQP